MSQASKVTDATAKAVSGFGTIMALNGLAQQGAYLIGSGILCNALSTAADKWANDPPRRDFASATRLRPPLLRIEALRPEDGVSEVALALAFSLDRAEANLTASLRAFERYQGAVYATSRVRRDEAGNRGGPAPGEDHAATERANEAMRFVHEAVPFLERASDELEALPSEIATAYGEGLAPPGLGSAPLAVDQLPDGTLAWLYRMGIPIRMFDRRIVLSRWRPDVLRDAADVLRDTSRHLADWRPPELA